MYLDASATNIFLAHPECVMVATRHKIIRAHIQTEKQKKERMTTQASTHNMKPDTAAPSITSPHNSGLPDQY